MVTRVETPLGPAVFDPALVQSVELAFERVCRVIEGEKQPLIVREVIARRVMAAAQAGTVDPVLLAEQAIRALGVVAERTTRSTSARLTPRRPTQGSQAPCVRRII